MIDTIWLILHHSTVNYKIDFMAEVGAKINVDIKRSNEYRIVGSLQNMQIYIEPTFVLIQGSLPKYYYGSNLVSLPRTELSNAIDKLSTDLGLPLREAIITRIDIGMNVEVDNPPRSYFSYFGILKKFERNIRRNSLYYEQKWCQLCFYDKVKEAKAHKDPLLTSEMLDKNILRYEIRYKHSWLKHYFKRNIKAKELFAKDPIVYLDLIAEWYLKYDDISKIDIMKPKFEMTLMGLLCRAVFLLGCYLRSSCSSLRLRAATATMPESATSAIMFGSTMSWLNISVSSQTRSLDRQEPRKMKMMAMME